MLKIEQFQSKVALYRDSVSDAGNGFAATSMTWAKKNILGFSDDEIILDLERQRMEKAAAAEMENTSEVIKSTGVFNDIDRLYGVPAEGEDVPPAGDTGGTPPPPPMGGGSPPPPMGGGSPPPPPGGDTEPEPPADDVMAETLKNYDDLIKTVTTDTEVKNPVNNKSYLIKEDIADLKENLDKLLE